MNARNLGFALIIAGAIVVDQASKWLVESVLTYQQSVELIPLLALYRTHNDGIAFSMLAGLGDRGLILLAVVVLFLVLFIWWKNQRANWLAGCGFALIVGGAIGNIIDRTLLGYVIDFILFHTEDWSFAVFNLADAFISVGAGLVILDELMSWWRQRNNIAEPGS